MKFNRTWAAAGLIGAANLVRECKKNAVDLVRIQTATVYLKGVEILRDLFLYQVATLVCVVFLVFGVILMEGAAIFYVPASTVSKTMMAFIVGALDSLTALAVLGYFASSKRWLKRAVKHNACLEELMEECSAGFRNGKERQNAFHKKGG